MSGSIAFKNILSIWVLKWICIVDGCKIKGANELEERECKTSIVWLRSLLFKKLTLKFPRS